MTAPRQHLVVECGPGEVRAALLQGEVLVDILVLRRTDGPRFGQTFQGQISRIEKGIDAAFVDIGSGPPGFLPLSGAARRLAEGKVIAVSIAAEATAGKGPRLALADGAGIPPQAAPEDDVAVALQAFDCGSLERIVADGMGCAARVRAAVSVIAPVLTQHIETHAGGTPAFEDLGVEEQIDRALAPDLELASGLRLRFGTLDALTAIDVDTASFVPRQAGRANALAANLSAAGEIARQIRLRNLAGLILVDFLRMQDAAERRRVSEAFASLAAADPVPHHVHGFTRAGLLELTRERRRRTLADIHLAPAQPRRKSAETVAREALRHTLRVRLRGAPVLVAARDVIAWLEGPGRADLAACEAGLHATLSLRADPDFVPDRFDIVGERPENLPAKAGD